MSYTFSLFGRSSNLSARYHPPVTLDADKEYVLGLISLYSYNAIPNIEKNKNNRFYYGSKGEHVEIPEGTYEIDSVNRYLERALGGEKWLDILGEYNPENYINKYIGFKKRKMERRYPISINIRGNNSTLKSRIKFSEEVDFTPKDSIGPWLGFKPRKLQANIPHESDFPVNIFKVNAICIECNIVTGSYVNDKQAHVLHEFFPTAPAGFKIVECPRNVVYLPINTRVIDEIIIKIVDQDGELVNFKQELVSLRLHLKQLE